MGSAMNSPAKGQPASNGIFFCLIKACWDYCSDNELYVFTSTSESAVSSKRETGDDEDKSAR